METIEPGAEIVPGIKAVAAYGHTPGHTAFQVSSDGQQLLIWGDIIHSHAIQFNRPDVAIEYDSDSTKAVMTRKNLLKEVSDKGELVAGSICLSRGWDTSEAKVTASTAGCQLNIHRLNKSAKWINPASRKMAGFFLSLNRPERRTF